MINTTTKRITSCIIVLTLFSSFIIIPQEALAAPLNWNNPNQNNAFKLDASTILNAGTLTAIVGCTGIVDEIVGAGLQLVGQISNTLLKATTVQVNDSASNAQQKIDSKRESCLNGIAYALAKQQLVSMTKATMNWVNSGFNGDPMYVRNITSLTDSIGKQILNNELDMFKNPAMNAMYPYGAGFAQSQISAYKSLHSSGDSLQADLTSYLSDGSTIQNFANDFSQGGWGGWLALTQKDANNPLGYTMNKSQQIADKQASEIEATKATIQQNGGFLDQKKCILWNMVDDVTGEFITEDVYDGENGWVTKIKTTTKPLPEDKCLKYETITPGSLIKDKITKTLSSPETQLELADSLNEVLYSIFGNLINKFQNNGLASLSSNTFGSVSNDIGSNSILDANGNAIKNVNEDSGLDTGSGFDITKDLGSDSTMCLNDFPNGLGADKKTCGIIETQQEYLNTVTKLFNPLYQVMFKLGELDYCIPGPNPSWQTNSGAKDAYINYLNGIAFQGGTELGRDSGRYYVTASGSKTIVIPDREDPNSPTWQNYLISINDAATGYWKDLTSTWYFNLFGGYDFSRGSQADTWAIITAKTDPRLNEIDKTEAEYKRNADLLYGPNSSMQTELLDDGTTIRENPEYLPMAQAGLNITKDIASYGQKTVEMVQTYQDRIVETRANLYKLQKISDKVNAIVKRAQAARDQARAKNGEPAISPECKANEKVNISQ